VQRLHDPRSGVILVAAELPHLEAEAHSVEVLCELLNVSEPPAWPPQYMTADVLAWFHSSLLEDAEHLGWLNYYVTAPIGGQRILAGCAGFKGKPDEQGEVEIGYTILPEFQRRGLASAAVSLLSEHAFKDERVSRIKAETLPGLPASIGVLARCGFTRDLSKDGSMILRFACHR
jgi:[ribosomal protein S5]-alanine N-acetyltransferase